jgi:spore maturation protein CgeB
VLFGTRDELKSKVDYYLAHSERRQEIADAGYIRAHRDHTYQVRMQRMLGVIYRPDGQALPASGHIAK